MTNEKSNLAPNGLGRHVIQHAKEYSVCVGCNACEIVCGLVHEGEIGQMLRRLFLDRDTINLEDHKILTCQQCTDRPCYEACPKKDEAMCVDAATGIVYVNEAACIGCKKCYKACPFEPKRINYDKVTKKAKKCDLCRNREAGPACIEYCQVQCLGLSASAIGRES